MGTHARIKGSRVVALVVGVLNQITLEHAVVGATHLLYNLSFFTLAGTRCLISTAKNRIVRCIVDMIEGVRIAHSSPENRWLVRT